MVMQTQRSHRLSAFLSAAVLGGVMVFAGEQAHAGSVVEITSDSTNSTSGLGSFTGSIAYSADNAFSTVGTLIITLTNTTDASIGGYITGFLFNIASSDPNASASLLNNPAPTHPFQTCSGNGLNGMPFGQPFDAGAALGGHFQGGGSPNAGIAVGETGVFYMQVNAADAGSLTAMDFLSGGPFNFDFIVRFKGIQAGEGSDKVPAMVIPLPAPFAMGAMGLMGVMVVSRRMRRKTAATK